MKKRLSFFFSIVLLLFVNNNTEAQYSEKQAFVYKETSYDIFIIKQDSFLVNKCSFIDNKNLMGEKEFFMSSHSQSFFAITSSIIESNCTPLGLFVKNGIKIKDINKSTQGSGSFYSIQPNGIFYITERNEFKITATPDFLQLAENLKLAIQTGPILVYEGNINPIFTANSKNKYIRCGVGVFNNKDGSYLVFAKSNEPVNFYDFADLFVIKYNCKIALNLESGANSSIHLPSHSSLKFNNGIHCCRYLKIEL